jgi:hypothetical protein
MGRGGWLCGTGMSLRHGGFANERERNFPPPVTHQQSPPSLGFVFPAIPRTCKSRIPSLSMGKKALHDRVRPNVGVQPFPSGKALVGRESIRLGGMENKQVDPNQTEGPGSYSSPTCTTDKGMIQCCSEGGDSAPEDRGSQPSSVEVPHSTAS